ncbi:ER membrane protein complex subunit 3 [Chlorella vulgaris]
MVATELVLDRDVRNWVLIPLTATVLLMQLLRQYMTQLFTGSKPPVDASKGTTEVAQKGAVARSNMLRANGSFMTEAGFRQRKLFFAAKDTGVLCQKMEAKGMQEMMMTNPDFMQGMMKQQLGGMLPQLALGALVNFFFSGFILGRIPFALSPKFRIMLQRGIDLPSIDPSYFTSLSYYFLLLFGLRGVLTLMFREKAINDAAQMMQMQQSMQAGPMGPMGFDAQKAFDAERAALNMAEHKWRLEGSEARAIRVLRSQLGGK